MASFTLVVYDHAITFAQEVTYFWSGSWSASRILYLGIRYLALIQMLIVFYVHVTTLSDFAVDQFFVAGYLLAFTVMVLCQCVVTLRVWHLFPRSRFIRWLALTILIVCTAGTAITSGFKFYVVKSVVEFSNPLTTQNAVFVIYLPSLIVHTAMFSLKVYRFRVSPKALQKHGIIHRFLKEGMLMYAFAGGTLLYEIISLSKVESENVPKYYAALGGEIAVGATVVSVCRAMLSIRSLAATYHVDPEWLLNHAELSRVHWRRGANEGEIYVEVNEMDMVLSSKSAGETKVRDNV